MLTINSTFNDHLVALYQFFFNNLLSIYTQIPQKLMQYTKIMAYGSCQDSGLQRVIKMILPVTTVEKRKTTKKVADTSG